MSKWIRAGKIKDAHGLKGELYVLLFAKEAPWMNELTEAALAVSDEGPFEILIPERAKAFKDGLILKAQQGSDRTWAESKRGQLFYLSSHLFISKSGESIYLREVHGFEVFDQNQLIGRVHDFSSNGPQDLLLVKSGTTQKVFEIPFVEAFLDRIDFEKRQIWMQLPEGLLSLDEQ